MRKGILVTLAVTAACAGHQPKLTVSPEMAAQYECDYEAMRWEWSERRGQPVAPGESLCVLLGRFGAPDEFLTLPRETHYSLSLTWSAEATAMAIRYRDAALAESLGQPPGKWIVVSFQVFPGATKHRR